MDACIEESSRDLEKQKACVSIENKEERGWESDRCAS